MGRTVADLKDGETGTIKEFKESTLTLKLLEMGFIPGTPVKINFRAPLGDPLSVRISDYDICIRLDEASLITLN